MSESMSCWICATIESALDDMAVLLLHNRWVVLPIIAQSRRSFNATMFTCRFRIRPHGLWSHSFDFLISMAQPQILVDPEAAHQGPFEGTEARSRRDLLVDQLWLHHLVLATFPADDALAGRAHVAVPVGALAPRHRHDEAIAGRSYDHWSAIGFARAATAVLDHAIQPKQPRPGQWQHQRIDNP